MGNYPTSRILSARSLLFLLLAIFLWGCVQVTPEGQVTSSSGNATQTGEEPALSITTETSSILPTVDNTPTARPLAPDSTQTALAIPQAAERALQTVAAQSTATQTARQALEGLTATGAEDAITEGESASSPTKEASGLSTPTPVSLLERFFEPLASFDSVLPGLVDDLRISPEGVLWAINENGIASWRGSTWTVHFPDVILWLVGFDDAGRTWMSNEPGTAVLSWNGSEWRIYGEGAGWLPIRTPSLFYLGEEMVSDHTGRIWMTTYKDVRSFDGTQWTVHNQREIGFEPFEETAQYDGFFFPAIEKDLQGNIWIGNCDFRGEEIAGQGARWFDGTSWRGNSEPTASGCVQDIEIAPDGKIWMGIDDLLWRYDPLLDAWTDFELLEPQADLSIGWIQDIQFGPAGNPWLAVSYCGGASCGSSYQRYRLQGETWINVPQRNDYDPGQLYFDPEGNAWIYSEKDLFRVQGSNLEQVLGLEFCCIAQDRDGWLYLAAKQGQLKLILVQKGAR